MDDSRPQISICIPTYNGEKYIARAIKSVLSQTFSDFEIIVSDDGSTDRTLEIVNSFDDARITRIDSLSKVGAEENWNNAVVNARADLIKLVCQDDLLYPECLQTEVQAMTLASNQDVAFCFSLRDFVTPNERFINGRRVGVVDQAKYAKSQILRKIVRSGGNPIGEPMAVTFRKSAFLKTGRFTGDYVIDLNMWVGLLNHGSALFIARRLSAFRISKTSWTSSLKKSQFRSVRSLSKKIYDENKNSISQFDLFNGQIVGRFRAAIRQIVSKLIIFGDRLLGSTR